MPTKSTSAALIGVDAALVEVEADIARGLPHFVIVGLPDTAVQESRERIRSALRNAGLPFPKTRLTVNLAPADIKKEGPSYDLPIAVAILEACGAIPPGSSESRLFVGELALDGTLRPVPGTLSIALAASTGGIRELFVPVANAPEAALADGVAVFPVQSIIALVRHLRGDEGIAPVKSAAWPPEYSAATRNAGATANNDFSDIRGQAQTKRALEVAAAGGHNILLSGPPGSGKTLLARAITSILPPLTRMEMLEVTKIHSVAGLLNGGVVAERPFRAPHHTASGTALVGGGGWPKPGEVSLAHRGVLFLDELPEFSRPVLENLRQPLEDGAITVARAGGTLTYPAAFMLVAARNPCPCGYASDPDTLCTCPAAKVAAYARKVSGPLLDRIDLHVEVPKIPTDELFHGIPEEPSAEIRTRVIAAREQQHTRLAQHGILTNAGVPHAQLRNLCAIDIECERVLRTGIARLGLSARAVTRIIRVARTIADLDGVTDIAPLHIAEAMQYREKKQ